MKKIALIACSNGYGHIRRLLLLSVALQKRNTTPVLFSSLKSTKIVAKSEGIHLPEVINFDTNTRQENWIDGTASDWVNRIPDISNYDIVVSDNLVEILLIRPDAWLSGSFFWHESLQNFPKYLESQALDLLDMYKPRMISSKLFTSNSVKEYTNIFEVGLYSLTGKIDKYIEKKDALIACGKGGSIKKQAKDFVTLLSTKEKTKFRYVLVDPDLLPSDYPSWMLPATFTRKMYQNIISAVIRPGIGTITNSLLAGARIFSFYEAGNKEMESNASMLKFYGVGVNTCSIDNAWNQAELFVANNKSQVVHNHNMYRLDMCGAKQAANILLKEYY